MGFHIGKIIEKRLKECGMAKSELARRSKVSPQLIQSILKRASVDTDVLRRISIALDYDFFVHYMGASRGNSSSQIMVPSGAMVEELQQIRNDVEVLTRHNAYLRELVELINPNAKIRVPARPVKSVQIVKNNQNSKSSKKSR